MKSEKEIRKILEKLFQNPEEFMADTYVARTLKWVLGEDNDFLDYLLDSKEQIPVYTTPHPWPRCLDCGAELPKEIQQTGMHYKDCPWNYYIECLKCGYQNSLSKLLGFDAGCSNKCLMSSGEME
jgi:hypothetical protein